MILCGLQSMVACTFFFTLLKGQDDTFFGYILSTTLFVFSFFTSASCLYSAQQGLWWTEGVYSGVASLPGLPIIHKTC